MEKKSKSRNDRRENILEKKIFHEEQSAVRALEILKKLDASRSFRSI